MIVARFFVAWLIICALLSPLFAEPIHNLSPLTCKSEGGSDLALPIGYHLTADDWVKLDVVVKEQQDSLTLLTAENKSLRESASKLPFGWGTVLALGVAFVAGGVVAVVSF